LIREIVSWCVQAQRWLACLDCARVELNASASGLIGIVRWLALARSTPDSY
jgi:hypothetical protein